MGDLLADFESELLRTQRRLEAWSIGIVSTSEEIRDGHARALFDQTNKLKGLEARCRQAKLTGQEVKERMAREKEAEALQMDAQVKLAAERDAAKQRLAAQQKMTRTAEQLAAKQDDALHAQATMSRKKLDALNKALALYSGRLGLELRRGADSLQLVFTQIDASDPERPFIFCVRILQDNSYEVITCDPAIEAMPAMLACLNSGNDFSGFVKTARAAFVAIAAQGGPMPMST